LADDPAARRLEIPRDQSKQGRFARAVRTNDGYAVRRVDRERDILEQDRTRRKFKREFG
jgi:hypothetical protein